MLRHYGPDVLGAPARTAQMTADSYRNRRLVLTAEPQRQRLRRFRRCCFFRFFHLAFWLLLSFARDALVHLNAIGRSVAAVSERPDPPLSSTTGRDLSQ